MTPSGLEIEVVGREHAPGAPTDEEVVRLVAAAVTRRGVEQGHVAVEFVDAARITALNAELRGKEGPTDVLSFPIDEDAGEVAGPRELGDIVICEPHTEDVREAIVHGALHLTGMDHEVDGGAMLALQDELMAELEPR